MDPIEMNISLRPAIENDAELLWELKSITLKPYIEQTWGWDENFQRRYFREHFTPSNSQIIQCDGKDVGVLTVEDNQLGPILSNIELYPQYQGLGIGTRLISDVIENAAQSGLPISLRVLKINPARQLYLRLGFTVIGETETHYWMRKEGVPREFLPDRWESSRCILTRVDDSTAASIQQVFTEIHATLELLGDAGDPAELSLTFIRKATIPPGGVAWRENRFLIRDLENRDTVGILAVYFGYPTPETMYIGALYLRPACQRRGYGKEIVAELEQRAAGFGFKEARAGVGLKNWPALRFWTNCGYSHITRIKGDSEFSDSSLAVVELLKDI